MTVAGELIMNSCSIRVSLHISILFFMQDAVIGKKFVFSSDPSRIIARFLYLSDERSANIIRKVLAMPEKEVNI